MRLRDRRLRPGDRRETSSASHAGNASTRPSLSPTARPVGRTSVRHQHPPKPCCRTEVRPTDGAQERVTEAAPAAHRACWPRRIGGANDTASPPAIHPRCPWQCLKRLPEPQGQGALQADEETSLGGSAVVWGSGCRRCWRWAISSMVIRVSGWSELSSRNRSGSNASKNESASATSPV